jgi:hypothetical protein
MEDLPMRKFVCTVLPVLAVALVLTAGSAVAQDNVFALSYFSNANTAAAPNAVLRLVNDGNVNDASPAGDLCASVYVFDTHEQLNECCSCKITPNGILSLTVNGNLTSNPLTGIRPTRGVVKVVSSYPYRYGYYCDATAAASRPGIRGWLTHIQKVTTNPATYSITEEELLDSTFGAAEATDLAEDCSVLVELGSGAGQCSCADTEPRG